MLSLAGGDPVPGDVLDMAWSMVPETDRRLFHEFCCLNQTNEKYSAAAGRGTEIIETALRPYAVG